MVDMTEKAKGNSVVTVTYPEAGGMILAIRGAGEVKFDKAQCSRECRAHAEDHGWEQRLRDAAAISRDDETGQPATPQDKFARVKALADYYMGGAVEWARVGHGGGGRSITIEAIARIKAVTYEQAEEFVARFAKREEYKSDTKKALAYLRTGKQVMEAIAAIRAERATEPKVDADAALEELK